MTNDAKRTIWHNTKESGIDEAQAAPSQQTKMGHHVIAQAGSFKGMYWTPLDSKYDQRQDVKTVKVRFGREMLCSLFSQKKSLFSQTKIKIWCVTVALLDGVITQSSHCVRIHAHQKFFSAWASWFEEGGRIVDGLRRMCWVKGRRLWVIGGGGGRVTRLAAAGGVGELCSERGPG